MCIHTTTNIHHVTAIKVDAKRLGEGEAAFISTSFTLTTEDGGEVSFSAFSKDHLAIEGAEHVNHVASDEPEPTAEQIALHPRLLGTV